MIRKKTLLIAGLLLAAGLATAAVTGVYGTLQGTADVQPALNISKVNESNDTVVVENLMSQEFDSSQNTATVSANDTSETLGDISAGASESVQLSSGTPNTLSGSPKIELSINGNVVDTENGGGSG